MERVGSVGPEFCGSVEFLVVKQAITFMSYYFNVLTTKEQRNERQTNNSFLQFADKNYTKKSESSFPAR